MKGTLWRLVCTIVLLFGVTGCMVGNEKKTTDAMLRYLEDKYGESFEAEYFDKGDALFPELYGRDKLVAYPAANKDIPFWVFKESKGYSDSYIANYFNYELNKLHHDHVSRFAPKGMEFRFSLHFTIRPQDPELLQRSAEQIANDPAFPGSLRLYAAVPSGEMRSPEQEAEFLYHLYTYMGEIADRPFLIAVSYVDDAHFAEAQRLLRYSPILNFDWSLLEDHIERTTINYGSGSDITDASFFTDYFK